MSYSIFDGQQEEERILHTITAHALSKNIAIARIVLLAIFFVFVMFMVGSVIPDAATIFHVLGIICALILIGAGYLWNVIVYTKDRTYITDRRIIRFDVVSPFLTTKRSLFWHEVMKAKAFAPNLFYKKFNVGTVVVEPLMADHENVIVTDVSMYDDVGNFIDKILFTSKNKSNEMANFPVFVPKPKGQRK
jgi:hypothetical protein